MTTDEKMKLLNHAVSTLREHFDTVEIVATYMEGTSTKLAGHGAGNIYARHGALLTVERLMGEGLVENGETLGDNEYFREDDDES